MRNDKPTDDLESICATYGISVPEGNFDYLENEIINFIDELPVLIDQAYVCVNEGDIETLERIARHINTVSNDVGAIYVVDVAEQLQEFCQSGQNSEIDSLLEQLDYEYSEVEKFFTTYVHNSFDQAA